MNIKTFSKIAKKVSASTRMPALFIGHGNPMNAITDNEFRNGWERIGKQINLPKAILCISAHWLTKGTFVTMSEKPRTIHDFGGFPDELFQQQYPAPGAVDYAKMTLENVGAKIIHEDYEWGLDHGAWMVLKNMYPDANIPVFQLSIDIRKPPEYHYELAKDLSFLRERNVLIIGSGNVVHNLSMLMSDEAPFDWAIEFDLFVKESIENKDHKALVNFKEKSKLATIAHPTIDHYLPLLYTLAIRDEKDQLTFFNDSFDLGSISMRSLIFN